jgi:hypothetical protein
MKQANENSKSAVGVARPDNGSVCSCCIHQDGKVWAPHGAVGVFVTTFGTSVPLCQPHADRYAVCSG